MVAFKATPRKIYASMPLDQDTARVMEFSALRRTWPDTGGPGGAEGAEGAYELHSSSYCCLCPVSGILTTR